MRFRSQTTRGFSLVEVMIATSVAIGAVAAAIAVGAQLQRRSAFEEQAMGAQQSARVIEELLEDAATRAGAGMGDARVVLGGTGGSAIAGDKSVYGSALSVSTGSAAQLGDSNFALPSGDYEAHTSDSVVFTRGRVETMTRLVTCGAGSRTRTTDGQVCTETPSGIQTGAVVLFVDPAAGIACKHVVTAVAGPNRLVTTTGPATSPANEPAATDPCNSLSGAFWARPGTFAMAADERAVRVNWHDGNAPALEYDSDGPWGPAPWRVLSREVERLRVRQGVVRVRDQVAGMTPATTWFPEPSANRPGLDACSATTPECTALSSDFDLPFGDINPTAPGALLDADHALRDSLQRRVRTVEFEVVMRSVRPDLDAVRKDASGHFLPDADGMPQDGLRRRVFTLRVHPRNFGRALASLEP
jgi:type II secretory pathway pseudopilin PulG